MSDKIKYGENRVMSFRELTERPGLPSQILREAEATLIGNLARSVALSGRKFDGWPSVQLVAEQDWFTGGHFRLAAEVVTK